MQRRQFYVCFGKIREIDFNLAEKINYVNEKSLLLKSINECDCEVELSLTFADKDNEYMIIIYHDHCSFQRCGTSEQQSGEYNYPTLDELYKAQQIDNIVLERDWDKITDIQSMDLEILGLW